MQEAWPFEQRSRPDSRRGVLWCTLHMRPWNERLAPWIHPRIPTNRLLEPASFTIAAMAMAGPALQACARSTSLLFQLPSSQPVQLGAATFRRGSHLSAGRHGCGDLWANQLSTSSHSLKAIFSSETNSSASASDDDNNDLPPAGCTRIKVELKKPLGIAFEEDELGRMMVGEVIPGGNADKSGVVDAGDQLIATSAIVYGSEQDYGGVMVKKGMQKVRLNVRGERFETVIAAIGTHPYYVQVEMEFQKCEPVQSDSLNGSPRN